MADSTTVGGGRRRLVCAPRTPWDPEDDVGNYEFNVLVESQTAMEDWNGGYINYGNIGTNDLSIECWFRYFPDGLNWERDEATPAGNNGVFCGWDCNFGGGGSNTFGLGFDGLNAAATFGLGRTPPVNTYSVTGTAPDDGDWHHWCVACDRSGAMAFYIDGVSLGTTDISAEVATNITSGHSYRIGHTRHFSAPGQPIRCMGFLGAAAFHTQVLTVAEIKDSVMGRRTQLVTNTVCRYDYSVTYRLNPQNIGFYDPETDATYYPNGWSRDIRRTNWDPLVNPQPYIVLQDLSGNGNDAGLRVPTWNHWVSYDPSWK